MASLMRPLLIGSLGDGQGTKCLGGLDVNSRERPNLMVFRTQRSVVVALHLCAKRASLPPMGEVSPPSLGLTKGAAPPHLERAASTGIVVSVPVARSIEWETKGAPILLQVGRTIFGHR